MIGTHGYEEENFMLVQNMELETGSGLSTFLRRTRPGITSG